MKPYFKTTLPKKSVVSPPTSFYGTKYKQLESEVGFRYYVLNQVLNFEKLMVSGGLEIKFNGTCRCPFHEGENLISAKLHPKEIETKTPEKLWCFSEHRMYQATDYLKIILGVEPYKEWENIWDKLNLEKQQQLKTDYLNRHSFNSSNSFSLEEAYDKPYLKLLSWIEEKIKNEI